MRIIARRTLISFVERRAGHRDYSALKAALDRFDHRFLNELEPFSTGVNPTAENLARIIFEELEKSPVFVRDSHLAAITVYEMPTSSVTYTRD